MSNESNEISLEQSERSPINNAQSTYIASKHSTNAPLSACERLDNQILCWLLHYPLQRIEDIALGVRAVEQTTRRHVQALAVAGLIEPVMFARFSWFYLTDRGIRTAAAYDGLDPRDTARMWQANERSLLHLFPRFPMLLSAQNLINDLVQGAPTSLAFQGRLATIRWRWAREYDMTCSSTKRRIVHCTADAAIVLRRSAPGELQAIYPDAEYSVLWLYFDLGAACNWSRAMITNQLRNLLLCRESQERLPYRSMFPLVVVLAGGEQQMERWQQAAHEAAKSLRLGKPLAGVIVNMTAHMPIASKSEQDNLTILHSCWHYDWRDLSTNQHCRLQERLCPMTLAAVPAGLLSQERGQSVQPTEPEGQALATTGKAGGRHAPVVKGKFQQRLSRLSDWPVSPAKEREMVSLLDALCELSIGNISEKIETG